ncbi:MAG: hypothetical protein A2010_07875 [Nitrospirae bacterium GWD2_57_9]|nr:MAG: hypothetical protein A2010_07875 [Nitrospirae bacterium GWD2_57_9]
MLSEANEGSYRLLQGMPIHKVGNIAGFARYTVCTGGVARRNHPSHSPFLEGEGGPHDARAEKNS